MVAASISDYAFYQIIWCLYSLRFQSKSGAHTILWRGTWCQTSEPRPTDNALSVCAPDSGDIIDDESAAFCSRLAGVGREVGPSSVHRVVDRRPMHVTRCPVGKRNRTTLKYFVIGRQKASKPVSTSSD